MIMQDYKCTRLSYLIYNQLLQNQFTYTFIMHIQVIRRTNPKLLNYFPIDPYSDFIVVTSNGTYQLQLSFLIIQSQYFEAKLTNKQSMADLKQCKQPFLELIIRALYGDQLIVDTIEQLKEIYLIAELLKIEEYKANIIKKILPNLKKWNPIELLQLCFCCKILEEEIKDIFFRSKLALLLNVQYQAQFRKVSPKVIILLLQQYHQRNQNEPTLGIINKIIKQYLKLNKISSQAFFQENYTLHLKNIWDKFNPIKSAEELSILNQELSNKKLQENFQINSLNQKIKELLNTIEEQNQTIKKLEVENQFFKEYYYQHNPKPPKLIKFYSEEKQQVKSNKKKSEKIINKENLQPKNQYEIKADQSVISSQCSIMEPHITNKQILRPTQTYVRINEPGISDYIETKTQLKPKSNHKIKRIKSKKQS